MKDIIVFDMDGTLSIVGDRLKYLRQDKPDWDSFYAACGEDKINTPIATIFLYFMLSKYELKIVTGRRESCRQDTMKWLGEHGLFIEPENLYLRPDGDFRHDTEVKPELVKDFKDNILMVFEDRNSMVKKWREMGITCLQVAEGDF